MTPPTPATPAMSRSNLQLSVTGLALSTTLQALGTVGRPFSMGQDARNIGKPVMIVAAAPPFSTCNKAEQAQPKSHRSPIETSGCTGCCGRRHTFKRFRFRSRC